MATNDRYQSYHASYSMIHRYLIAHCLHPLVVVCPLVVAYRHVPSRGWLVTSSIHIDKYSKKNNSLKVGVSTIQGRLVFEEIRPFIYFAVLLMRRSS